MGLWAVGKASSENTPLCFGIDTDLSSLSSTPVYLARLSIFPSVYHHSDVLQRQTFLGLLWGNWKHTQGMSSPEKVPRQCPHPPPPPKVTWGGCRARCSPAPAPGALPGFLLLTYKPHLGACLAKDASQEAPVLSSLSPSHILIDPPPQFLHPPPRFLFLP